ncbi:uncharacterized protein LOC127788482 [Diospyros lotus]|uniref:uncharacterized protein LOC127788482 n=1 Tax=Diospyros lotus TaxID=55363 RepID=UPI00224D1E06|nr:uncharacterized protein LOC127788482 [Diospyros lotus]
MNSLFRACTATILSRTGDFVARNSFWGFSVPSWKVRSEHPSIRTVNLGLRLTIFRVQCYSPHMGGRGKSRSRKLDSKPFMDEEKNAFFVVRKGDIVGIYKNLSDCQIQVGSSISDPPVSVYKGYSMPQDTEEYLLSRGLKNALYSIRAADLKEDLFGPLVPCPFQQPPSSIVETPSKDLPAKRSHEVLGAETMEVIASTSIAIDPSRKHIKRSCILEFDGASKGNPGQAGAGAVLRADDGTVICRLRQGLGIATCNAAEYRAILLGMKEALKKGYTNIRAVGDSKLVCLQVQGIWKVKNQNMSELHGEVKKLKDKFLSFEISHVLRNLNSEADAQANLATHLADGQIEEEIG